MSSFNCDVKYCVLIFSNLKFDRFYWWYYLDSQCVKFRSFLYLFGFWLICRVSLIRSFLVLLFLNFYCAKKISKENNNNQFNLFIFMVILCEFFRGDILQTHIVRQTDGQTIGQIDKRIHSCYLYPLKSCLFACGRRWWRL